MFLDLNLWVLKLNLSVEFQFGHSVLNGERGWDFGDDDDDG